MRLPLRVPARFRIIAHRGASGYAPENTLAAFRLAERMGVREFELDVQIAADGPIVACHDRTLERYGHGDRTVEDLAWDELSLLDMGSWFSPFLYGGEPMATLEGLFDAFCGTVTYHIELKGERAKREPEAVARLIADRGLRDRCIITSFSYATLAAVRVADPVVGLGWLVGDPPEHGRRDIAVMAREVALFQVCPPARSVSREAVRRLHEAVAEVRAWGITAERREALRLLSAVIDAGCDGVTLDWPDWLTSTDQGPDGEPPAEKSP